MIAPAAAAVAIAQYGNRLCMWWLRAGWRDDENVFFVDKVYVTIANDAA